MSGDTFTEDEIKESEFFEEAEKERKSPPKKSVKQYINSEKFKADVSINITDVESAIIDQASLFAYYATQSSRAAEQVDDYKLQLDVIEARLNNAYRDKFAKEGVKYTETVLTNSVLTNAKYIEARKLHNEAKGVSELIKGTVEAFKARKDMLIQLGTNAREERKGNLFFKAKEQEGEDYLESVKNRKRKMVER